MITNRLLFRKGLSFCRASEDGDLSVYGNVDLSGSLYKRLPVRFASVTGHFSLLRCRNLQSMAGLPEEIGGDLDLRGCEKLKDLSESPRIVYGKVDVRGNAFLAKELPKLIQAEEWVTAGDPGILWPESEVPLVAAAADITPDLAGSQSTLKIDPLTGQKVIVHVVQPPVIVSEETKELGKALEWIAQAKENTDLDLPTPNQSISEHSSWTIQSADAKPLEERPLPQIQVAPHRVETVRKVPISVEGEKVILEDYLGVDDLVAHPPQGRFSLLGQGNFGPDDFASARVFLDIMLRDPLSSMGLRGHGNALVRTAAQFLARRYRGGGGN